MLSTVWCHLSCGALVRKLGDEGKTFLHLIEKTKVKQQDDGSWHYQVFFQWYFHSHNPFTQAVCSQIDFLVPLLQP